MWWRMASILLGRVKKTKMSGSSIKLLAEKYRQLSFDEKEFYRELGARMTAAGKLAQTVGQAKNSTTRKKSDPCSTLVGAASVTVDDILTSSDSGILALPGDSWEDRLVAFSGLVAGERKSAHQERVKMMEPKETTSVAGETDVYLQDMIPLRGGDGHMQGLRLVPNTTATNANLSRFTWRVPILSYVQACVFLCLGI